MNSIRGVKSIMRYLAAVASLALLSACSPPQQQTETAVDSQLTYPVTVRGNVTDEYFGTIVADPYRWLEDDRSAETKAWVKALIEVTFGYLEQIPYRQQIKRSEERRVGKEWKTRVVKK